MQSFYSNGINYNGLYGDYYLLQYDLIRGEGIEQKNAYYDGLVSWYGNDLNFKTNLFPNGLISNH